MDDITDNVISALPVHLMNVSGSIYHGSANNFISVLYINIIKNIHVLVL